MKNEQKYDFYWDRRPGMWVDLLTGQRINNSWDGTIRDWYEILAATVIKICHQFENQDNIKIIAAFECSVILEISQTFSLFDQPTFGTSSMLLNLPRGALINKFPVYQTDNNDGIVEITDGKTTKILKITG